MVANKKYLYKKINGGGTSDIFLTNNKEYIFKKNNNYLICDVFKREIFILNLLEKNSITWSPKLIHYDDNNKILMMTYCGQILTSLNKPDNYLAQFVKILKDMKKLNMQHNDIKKNNEVLVIGNKIYICDFGWASINNKLGCGIGLWDGEKPWGIIDDNLLLTKIYFS